MYRKIIVPVEMGQLDKGEKILRKAVALLDAGGEIVLLNVAENIPGYLTIDLPPDFIDTSVKDAEDRLKLLSGRCDADAEIVVRIGSPAREIIATADDLQADLIIIASHRPNLSNYLLGSTADRVVRHANCSVLVDR
ncbi:universal stress protein [Rhizobium sp. KVB221]|uniref:Universal stress protein n=1 Tax=Rhizobium setariae TaxID=2801340 RepID=A0A937CJD3_9HYPH|nr:universal stress protein [Rhizobium setariae]MBL0370985.1 universal stress protein [Rhizobium setariae]